MVGIVLLPLVGQERSSGNPSMVEIGQTCETFLFTFLKLNAPQRRALHYQSLWQPSASNPRPGEFSLGGDSDFQRFASNPAAAPAPGQRPTLKPTRGTTYLMPAWQLSWHAVWSRLLRQAICDGQGFKSVISCILEPSLCCPMASAVAAHKMLRTW